MKFDASKIGDAKRATRGEHLHFARSLLRSEAFSHHPNVNVLMLCGGEPSEEIGAIRTLFRRSRVVAIDVDPACVARAQDAGADIAVVYELPVRDGKRGFVPPELGGETFDVIDLDLCSPITEQSMQILSDAFRMLRTGGVLLLTFMYGRDVVEHFISLARGGRFNACATRAAKEMIDLGLQESLVGRLLAISAKSRCLECVTLYNGPSTPMCATVWRKTNSAESWPWRRDADVRDPQNGYTRTIETADTLPLPSVAILEGADLDRLLAVDYDRAMLYGCPASRVIDARRKIATERAVLTRTSVTEPKKIVQKITRPSNGGRDIERDREVAQLVVDEFVQRGLAGRRPKTTAGVVFSDVERLRRLGMRPRLPR